VPPEPMDAYPYFVHVVVKRKGGDLACRPAVAVLDWNHDGHMIQAQVFTDADNDKLPPVLWATSVEHSLEGRENTYHLMREHGEVVSRQEAENMYHTQETVNRLLDAVVWSHIERASAADESAPEHDAPAKGGEADAG
jgi:hypothetical protein